MNEIPKIVMQCPKCKKEFPFDTNYCEDCTAMLEPMEQAQETPLTSTEAPSKPTPMFSAPGNELIEDVRIDSLKSYIEESFVSTLLYELKSLKNRMKKKEDALSALHGNQTDINSPELIQKIGRAETEVNEVLRRTAKIEAILENMKKKLEADIDSLQAQITATEQPGLFWFLSSSGRYFSMLSSELKVKKALLTAIETRTFSRRKKMLKYAFFFIALLCVTGITIYSWNMQSQNNSDTSSSAAFQRSAPNTYIQGKDVRNLLEDIRIANINKDLLLWESRYAKQYLASGKKSEEAAEKWKKFDYVSLQYKVEDIQWHQDRITAIIAWDMELRSAESGKIIHASQRLISEFIVEDNKLKIASVSKAEP